MAKVYATMSIHARFEKEIEVDDPSDIEEIKKKMDYEFCEADFGAASDIDGMLIIVEDKDGNYIYEK